MIGETITSPEQRDRRALLEALARAFLENPMNRTIHGSNEKRRLRANRVGLAALVLDAADMTQTRVVWSDGRIVGGYIAAPPGRFALPAPSLGRQLACAWHQGARGMDQWGEVNAKLSVDRPLVEHWYVAVLGVEPKFQGRGLGSRLVRDVLETASGSLCPVYLESDRPESVRLYEAHGFVKRGETQIHGVACARLGAGFADETRNLCDSVR